jgi:hypothetical protein
MKALIIALAFTLAACASTDGASPDATKQAVSEAPCNPSKRPQKRTLPADALTGDENIFVWGATMWADFLARRAYQLEMETFIDECTKPKD